MSSQYDTQAKTGIFRFRIQHHTSQWPRKAFASPYSYAGIATLKQPTGPSSFSAMLSWQWTDVSEESSTLTSPNPIRHLMVQFYIKNIVSFWPRMAIISYPRQGAGSLWFHAGWPTYEVPLKTTPRLLLSSSTWLLWHTQLFSQFPATTISIRFSGVWN